jgi:hypothetical protein
MAISMGHGKFCTKIMNIRKNSVSNIFYGLTFADMEAMCGKVRKSEPVDMIIYRETN